MPCTSPRQWARRSWPTRPEDILANMARSGLHSYFLHEEQWPPVVIATVHMDVVAWLQPDWHLDSKYADLTVFTGSHNSVWWVWQQQYKALQAKVRKDSEEKREQGQCEEKNEQGQCEEKNEQGQCEEKNEQGQCQNWQEEEGELSTFWELSSIKWEPHSSLWRNLFLVSISMSIEFG